MLYFWIFGLKIACSVLNLCQKGKRDITEVLTDTTIFQREKLALRGNGVKILGFVNQSNINKP